MLEELQTKITEIWEQPELAQIIENQQAIEECIALLDKGKIRVAEKKQNQWVVHDWIKKAILLYFKIKPLKKIQAGDLQFFDKIDLKSGFKENKIRAVPHALARYGSYIAPGVVLMPSYVNIGAYIDENTMVDTWATVGSCAQIGKNVHLSGGVGIGGVLEPLQARPVIIEDGCFIGSRSIVVEGVIVEQEAVLGANVVITQSTKIIDVSGSQPVEYKGRIPARSVVIPGTYTKKFPAGEFQVACALIIGKRKSSTDLKTSLNEVLREYSISL